MQKNMLNKTLVVSVIVLFIGASIVTGMSEMLRSEDDEAMENELLTSSDTFEYGINKEESESVFASRYDKGIASSSTTADYKSFFNRHAEGESNILNKNWNWQWAKGAGGTDYDVGAAIVTLSDESIIVTGSFSGSAIWGKGESSETTLTSDGSTDIFLAKHNPDGTIAWAKRAGGTSGDVGRGLVLLSDDSIIVTGSFSGSAIWGKGESSETTLTSDGSTDIFLAKHNPDGTIAWAKRAGGTSGDVGLGIVTLSDGSTIVIGSFRRTVTFGTTTLTSQGASDVFVAKIGTEEEIVCGDANADGVVDVSDAVFLINYLFIPESDSPEPQCRADANGDGMVNVSDAVYIINYVFISDFPAPVDDCCG